VTTDIQKAIRARSNKLDRLLANLRQQLAAMDRERRALEIGIAEVQQQLQFLTARDRLSPAWVADASRYWH
jgi:hypothetical protein